MAGGRGSDAATRAALAVRSGPCRRAAGRGDAAGAARLTDGAAGVLGGVPLLAAPGGAAAGPLPGVATGVVPPALAGRPPAGHESTLAAPDRFKHPCQPRPPQLGQPAPQLGDGGGEVGAASQLGGQLALGPGGASRPDSPLDHDGQLFPQPGRALGTARCRPGRCPGRCPGLHRPPAGPGRRLPPLAGVALAALQSPATGGGPRRRHPSRSAASVCPNH